MTSPNRLALIEFDFYAASSVGLLLLAAGFEDRARGFVERISASNFRAEQVLIVRYDTNIRGNELNFARISDRIRNLLGRPADVLALDPDPMVYSSRVLKERISEIAPRLSQKTAIVDISGLTQPWMLVVINQLIAAGIAVRIVYSEATKYFPLLEERDKLLEAWNKEHYQLVGQLLQSASLRSLSIPPEFAGSRRSGRPTCLIVFAGYEPHRLSGLIDDYAPSALIVVYGRSPHKEMGWRTKLSRELHGGLFSKWPVREVETSTLEIPEILSALEREFEVVRETFDVALSPQCSKLQAVASYLFWREHPEVQLIFTSPVAYSPGRYSSGIGRTFSFDIPPFARS